MKCTKCNHVLPADSEFCQYCGIRIEKSSTSPSVGKKADSEVTTVHSSSIKRNEAKSSAPSLLNYNKVAPDEVTNAVLQMHAQNSIESTEANNDVQSSKSPFGFTLVNNTTPPSSASLPQKDIPVSAPIPQMPKSTKNKYCSKCGSSIDGKTKKCTGCGKQYFRGLRLTKFSVIVIVLILLIACLSTLCVFQHLNTQKLKKENQAAIVALENKIINLEWKVNTSASAISTKDARIKQLKEEIDELYDEKWESWLKLCFFDNHAEIVPDDGTRVYHKYGCEKLDTSDGFWIYNSEAVEGWGYTKCSHCH